jgi:hypothetical protein
VISRTDVAGDRRLRGRTVFVLGQIAVGMAFPTLCVFVILPVVDPGRPEGEKVIWGIVPSAFLLMVSVITLFAGLGWMLRDLFVRQREIVEKHDAERRRRLEEEPGDSMTELIPERLADEEFRQHIKEDR